MYDEHLAAARSSAFWTRWGAIIGIPGAIVAVCTILFFLLQGTERAEPSSSARAGSGNNAQAAPIGEQAMPADPPATDGSVPPTSNTDESAANTQEAVVPPAPAINIIPAPSFETVSGEPGGGASDFLSVARGAPVVAAACLYRAASCIRMYVEIRPRGIPQVSLAAATMMGRSQLLGTELFSNTGVTCYGFSAGGIPEGVTYTSGEFGWGTEGAPFVATQSRPGTMMVEFSCGERLVPGDEVRAQLTVFADPDGRGIQLARFVFSGMRLRIPR